MRSEELGGDAVVERVVGKFGDLGIWRYRDLGGLLEFVVGERKGVGARSPVGHRAVAVVGEEFFDNVGGTVADVGGGNLVSGVE